MEADEINSFDPIADVYDQLVSWAPYEKWVPDLIRRLEPYGLKRGQLVLDAACGTGLSTIPWAERGYRVVGTDRSEKMLQQARRKLEGRNLEVSFVRRDLLRLDLPLIFDVSVCMHSGLDYILDLEDLARAFRCLRGTLRAGGLLAFDKCLDEPGFYRRAYSNSRRISGGTAVFHYSWDKKRKLFQQRCVVLWQKADGSSARTEVVYLMRAIRVKDLIEMIESAGFEVLEPPRQFAVTDPGMGICRAV